MADRTVSVNLRASVGQYLSAMASAGSATKGFGTTLSRVGAGMTRMVTLPVLAAAGASTFMALKYEDAFTRIDAVSNASQKQIASWKEEVLGIAGKTAQAPQELAEALYFLASAGLKSADIMPALEASAKAAATGMGSLEDNSRLVANVLNAYPKAGMKAVDVMDVLTSALKEGTAAPEEFTAAIGRILPIASKAGVGFDEVAASLSSLSNIGLDVNEGVTAMRGLLQSLVAPGTQAADTLKKIGISTDELRAVISEEGILGALRLLDERTKGNIDTMRDIVPNIRALTGQLGLTGQEAEKVDATFQKVAHSTGELDRAFQTTKRGPMFEFKQALANLQVVAIQVGQDILPVVTKIVEGVGDLAKAFTSLPESAQGAVIWAFLVSAALGPVISLVGRLVTLGAGLRGLFTGAAAGAGTAAAGKQLTLFEGAAAGATARTIGLVAAVAALAYTLGTIPTAPRTELSSVFDYAVAALAPLNLSVAEHNGLVDAMRQKYGDVATSGQRLALVALSLGQHVKAGSFAFLDSADAAGQFLRVIHGATEITQEQRNAVAGTINTLHTFGDSLSRTESLMVGNLLAAGDFAGAMRMLNGIVDQTIGRVNRQSGAHHAAGAAAADQEQKVKGLAAAFGSLPDSVKIPVTANTGQAQAAVDRFITANDGRVIGVRVVVQGTQISAVGGGHQAPHAGGVVGASGMRRLHGGGEIGPLAPMPILRGDEELVVGQRGERMLSKAELAMLQSILGGGSMTRASGGSPTGSGDVYVDVGDVTINDGSDYQDLIGAIASGVRRERLARSDL